MEKITHTVGCVTITGAAALVLAFYAWDHLFWYGPDFVTALTSLTAVTFFIGWLASTLKLCRELTRIKTILAQAE